jgi:hypothetical protein
MVGSEIFVSACPRVESCLHEVSPGRSNYLHTFYTLTK